MKKNTVALLALMLAFVMLFAVGCDTLPEDVDELVVYNWADYIYDYEDDFKEYYKNLTGRDIKVTYVTFDTNETMLTKILNGDSIVDVMCPSEYAIQKLLENGLLRELNYFGTAEEYIDTNSLNGYVHNSENIDSRFIEKIDEVFGSVQITDGDGTKTVRMADYFVPYMYGTLGVLYNKVYFEELGIYDRETLNNANWGLLFNDDGSGNLLSDGLTGRIYMKDSIRDSYAATVFYLLESGKLDGLTVQDTSSSNYGKPYTELTMGQMINTVDDQLIDLCADVLKKQKEQLYGYEVDFGKNELIQGIAYVDLAWSGDALYAVEESWDDDYIDPMLEYEEGESGGYTLGYYVPHDSGNIWFDGWVIPTTCPDEHLQAAKIFINFLNELYVSANNMMEIGYTSAVSAEKVRNDPECREILAQGYLVYGEDWEITDEDGNVLSQEDCDYASWEEFAEYFFDYVDPIDDSNWRYPFEIVPDNEYGREINQLGVMKDFGANNNKVSTMWEDVRSTGITAWALLGWTSLALAVVVGVIALVLWLKRRKMMYVVVKKSSTEQHK